MTNEYAKEIIQLIYEKQIKDDFKLVIKDETAIKFEEAFNKAIKALEQTRWISVSERLPEKGDYYFVSIGWKGSYSGDIYIETNIAEYKKKQKEWDCAGVIAWMPLPQPYNAEGEEDKADADGD